MTYAPLIGALCAALIALPAAADVSKTYDYSGFDALDIAAGISVVFEAAPTYSVVADFGEGDGPDDVKIRQRGDRLYVSRVSKNGWGKDTADVTVRITGPSLSAIEASSGSTLSASGFEAGALRVDVSSGASVSASGTCTRLRIKANSGGSANARQVICNHVKACASSGGSVRAHANTGASSRTSSGGSVDIWGDPAERKANNPISGGSTVFH